MDSTVDDAARIRQLEDRLHVLTGALREFAEATTDYQGLLDVIARKLAAIVKDGCVVRLFSDDGWLVPVAIHLPIETRVGEPGLLARLRAHVAAPHHMAEQSAALRVLETGEALLVPKLDFAQLRASATPEIAHAYEAIGIHSILLVALRVRGESIGLLSLSRFAPDSPAFNERDRELAQALTDHAALAITNAHLVQSSLHQLAERERAEAALRKTEDQLRHAQKMEAVRRLAGGVAHGFNNSLSVILSYAEIIGEELRPEEASYAGIGEIKAAGLRAAELTRQLLAFSRQQMFDLRVLDLNKSIAGMEKILGRLLGTGIELIRLGPNDLGNVKTDAGQIEQVVMNLAVNARDAMPQGGKLTIETANVELDKALASAHHGVSPGSYVMLSISDTGVGMDKATQAQIFEPFFTTKEASAGKGLGLATVFGIIKQNGGHISVQSEPGVGTTFKLYLPRVNEAVETPAAPPAPLPVARGKETILLVEDEAHVRILAALLLRRSGYVVLEAQSGGDALLVSEQHPSRIDLLLTDVGMPRMNGRQLAERLAVSRPEMKVLFMSGYAHDAMLERGVPNSRVPFLPKPITPTSLTRMVREVLRKSAE